MSVEIAVLVVVVILVIAAALLASYLTANRLDRLHIRTDLARTSLAGALERRHTVGAAIARELTATDPDLAGRLGDALAGARTHPPGAIAGVDATPVPDRRQLDRHGGPDEDPSPDAELAENRLAVTLAGVDAAALPEDLARELDDVTDRVAIARRFYNDAVRDTRSLREHPIVRALRLAGRAPMPDYVELVDGPPPRG